jgi:hypothetical protein
MSLKSYEQFVNENLIGQYSYYGQGSLFPIVSKLASEGKNAQQIYLYLTTLGIDEERKRRVISQVFLNESTSIDFDKISSLNEGLFEDDIDDLVNANPKDLEKGIDPSKAKPDTDVKAALDKLKTGDEESEEDKKDTEKTSGEEEDKSTKVAALQAALKDAEKLEKIKKILTEALGMDIEGVEEAVLSDALEYHLEEKLSAAEREKLKDSDFVFSDRRAWPIHDEKHAKTALIWATWPQYKNLKSQIVSAVLKKYPNLKGIGAAK